ncbi:MAG: class I SAM-dependent methyltransferase [Flavobacterium sp.]|uniref:class I SAM-dependent methyltransferase n=1 Tax=Flavobacterium sp. TaxID=239 RepID=UPI0035287805
MKSTNDYLLVNKQTWNNKTEVHVNSDFYNNDAFLKGKSSLNAIEVELLGDISDKKILHLQCHFGQDSLSLARLGATVTGVDLSDNAIEKATSFAKQLDLKATFICADIYSLPTILDEKFDLIFTSYGTIGWLPDLDKWAKVVSHFLKPNGTFIMADFHPVVWMYDDDFEVVFYNYFNVEPIIENETGTYADRYSNIEAKTITWNHPISELLNALISNNLVLNQFNEFDYSPYNCFNKTEEFEKGKFRISHFENKIPMVYSILATKK